MWERVRKAWKQLLAVGVVFGAGFAGGFLVWGLGGGGATGLPAADTPPAEYFYLDTTRLLAYLGQIENGLAPTEQRTFEHTEALQVAGSLGGASASRSRNIREAIQGQVTPAAADHFFELLRQLRAGTSIDSEGNRRPWLREIDDQVPASAQAIRQARFLCSVHEGDFVRISDARLYLPPYVSALPRLRYAGRLITGPLRHKRAPSPLRQAAVARYRDLLGRNPRLPFIAPMHTPNLRWRLQGVTVLLPARYKLITGDPSLLRGRVSIVGKVAYEDLRVPGQRSCGRFTAQDRQPVYVDRDSVTRYVRALHAAPPLVRRILGIRAGSLIDSVAAAVTVPTPLLVVIPVAIYD
jgi:hypothetical protein